MMTDRDKRVVIAVGNHKILSRKQIQRLFFPSEFTCWRRISKELQPKGYLSDEFYFNVNGKGKSKKLYRLEKKGKKLYKELTGKDYNTPRWNYNYIPHLLEVNWLIIGLELEHFELEYNMPGLQADIYFKGTAIEVDLSEKEGTKEIQRQYRSYEKVYKVYQKPKRLIFYSNRTNTLQKWISEIKKTNLMVYFVHRRPDAVYKLSKKCKNWV